MRATVLGWGALTALLIGAAMAQANPYRCGIPQAPDACGPGYYVTNPYGMVYGPNYWLRPPGLPFNGLLVPPGGGQFKSHPYARSPRDFFMTYDNWWDLPYTRP